MPGERPVLLDIPHSRRESIRPSRRGEVRCPSPQRTMQTKIAVREGNSPHRFYVMPLRDARNTRRVSRKPFEKPSPMADRRKWDHESSKSTTETRDRTSRLNAKMSLGGPQTTIGSPKRFSAHVMSHIRSASKSSFVTSNSGIIFHSNESPITRSLICPPEAFATPLRRTGSRSSFSSALTVTSRSSLSSVDSFAGHPALKRKISFGRALEDVVDRTRSRDADLSLSAPSLSRHRSSTVHGVTETLPNRKSILDMGDLSLRQPNNALESESPLVCMRRSLRATADDSGFAETYCDKDVDDSSSISLAPSMHIKASSISTIDRPPTPAAILSRVSRHQKSTSMTNVASAPRLSKSGIPVLSSNPYGKDHKRTRPFSSMKSSRSYLGLRDGCEGPPPMPPLPSTLRLPSSKNENDSEDFASSPLYPGIVLDKKIDTVTGEDDMETPKPNSYTHFVPASASVSESSVSSMDSITSVAPLKIDRSASSYNNPYKRRGMYFQDDDLNFEYGSMRSDDSLSMYSDSSEKSNRGNGHGRKGFSLAALPPKVADVRPLELSPAKRRTMDVMFSTSLFQRAQEAACYPRIISELLEMVEQAISEWGGVGVEHVL